MKYLKYDLTISTWVKPRGREESAKMSIMTESKKKPEEIKNEIEEKLEKFYDAIENAMPQAVYSDYVHEDLM
ncbi:hypothetical protein L596_023698 [Steinernema carpocapsae]|uniref:Uncharacterized protein n=1 Tax=Steinernema carpocapsae TaxID=34508 RepID=A0A4U5MEF6_STECR|nr:hypothetical protein L596_023698 [Steinernema carpocapsae]